MGDRYMGEEVGEEEAGDSYVKTVTAKFGFGSSGVQLKVMSYNVARSGHDSYKL